MTQISLNSQPLGFSSIDTEGTYVGGPVTFGALPTMVRRKFIGQTAQKVVRLADIYRVPRVERSAFAGNIHSGNGKVDGPDRV